MDVVSPISCLVDDIGTDVNITCCYCAAIWHEEAISKGVTPFQYFGKHTYVVFFIDRHNLSSTCQKCGFYKPFIVLHDSDFQNTIE